MLSTSEITKIRDDAEAEDLTLTVLSRSDLLDLTTLALEYMREHSMYVLVKRQAEAPDNFHWYDVVYRPLSYETTVARFRHKTDAEAWIKTRK